MEISELKDWAGVLAFVLSTATLFYAWLNSKSRVNEEHLKRVDDRLQGHANRIQQLENEMKHLPEKDDVNDLKLNLAELKGVVGRLDEGMSGMSRTVTRVEEFLLNKGGN